MGKKYDLIVKEVNALFAKYQMKMTLRQVYYRLVAKLIIPNTINEYKALSRLLVKARENEDVDYRKIEDRARTTIGYDDGSESPKEYLDSWEKAFRRCWQSFTMQMWKTQPQFVEVWIEKDALSRVVSEEAMKFKVKTCPSKGYSSFTYIADAVNRLGWHKDQKCVILYAGDYDPSGMDITRDLQDRLTRYGADVTVKRIALSLEQIKEYNLPPMPAKTTDARYAKFVADTGGSDAVELDALEPPVLQQVVRDAVKEEIDSEAWNARVKEINENKDKMRVVLENLEIDWGTEWKDEEGE